MSGGFISEVFGRGKTVTPVKGSWSSNLKSELVEVPLFPYTLSEETAESLVRFGAQFSVLANAICRNKAGKELTRLYLPISNVFSSGDKGGYLIHAGVAFSV
jgi:hypothetical protein